MPSPLPTAATRPALPKTMRSVPVSACEDVAVAPQRNNVSTVYRIKGRVYLVMGFPASYCSNIKRTRSKGRSCGIRVASCIHFVVIAARQIVQRTMGIGYLPLHRFSRCIKRLKHPPLPAPSLAAAIDAPRVRLMTSIDLCDQVRRLLAIAAVLDGAS